MRAFQLAAFGLENLRLETVPDLAPGPRDVLVRLRAASLNYRDLAVIRGEYNPRLPLPFTPLSDGAGEIVAVGPEVRYFKPGERVVTHYLPAWQKGPFRFDFLKSALGGPGPGMAAEYMVVSELALLRFPPEMDFAQAATLPVAALTAWSALVRVGGLSPEKPADHSMVLTLGTGGVSIFALQIAAAFGAKVIVTSGSDEKLARAQALGAWQTVNYRTTPEWGRRVMDLCDSLGAHITIETGGSGTLEQSMRATRANGRIAFMGSLTGLKSEVSLGLLMMKRLRLEGVVVDSRETFRSLLRLIAARKIRPVIDRRFAFEELPAALNYVASARHFGKVVVEWPD